MFSVPQPIEARPQEPPIVDVHDSPEALQIFLQIIYPFKTPPTDHIETLLSVHQLADKYDANVVFDYIPSICFNSTPIQAYAIFCACHREKDAGAAARRVALSSLTSLSDTLLQLMTFEHHRQLTEFMVARNIRMQQMANKYKKEIMVDLQVYCLYKQCTNPTHRCYADTIVDALLAAFEANPCIRVFEAFAIAYHASPIAPSCRESLRDRTARLCCAAEGLLGELVKMAETLPWKGQDAGV